MGAQYEFGLLGPLGILRDGLPVGLAATRLRVLLASLLLDAGETVPVDTLVARVWGCDPPRGARNTLQNHVLRLRRALGPELVRTHGRGCAVDVDPAALDTHRFAGLVRLGARALESGDPAGAAALLREGLGLWRGEPLSDLPGELFQDVAPGPAEQRLHAQELCIDADPGRGRPTDVLPELCALTERHPLRERFWAQRMPALYRCGRQGEALACYRRAGALLAEAAALALRLLRAAPGLRILATSRERFGVPDEHVLVVPGLTLPGPQPAVPSEALRLLSERAAGCAPASARGCADSAPAAELCRLFPARMVELRFGAHRAYVARHWSGLV